MAIVSAIESFLERLFEAPIGRLFGAKMQPIALAKRIERAMDTNRQFTNDGVLVPNQYELHLHPADYAVFESYRTALEDDLAHEVLGRARRERYGLVARPRVSIVRDEGTRRGDIRVAANIVDERGTARPAPSAPPVSSDTRVFSSPAPPQPQPRPQPVAPPRTYLIVHRETGPAMRFDLGGQLISIGRGAENDLILDDPQVSRHHCQLKLQQGAYSLTDMGSTNGSYVNGQRISEIALGPGDIIEVGGTRIEFQVRG